MVSDMNRVKNKIFASVLALVLVCCSSCSQESSFDAKTDDTTDLDQLVLSTTNMNAGRTAHTATLLTDGRVLVVGGSTDARAEILDQAGENQQFTGALATNRLNHAAILLPNGKVWVVGGQPQSGGNYLASTELYNPATEAFFSGPNLTVARKAPTLNLLRNGNVLICGGQSDFSTYLDTCELYDPMAETITLVPGAMQHTRAGHTAVLLQDGNVLICGGMVAQNTPALTCDRYNTDTNDYTAVQPMSEARASHTATVLSDGQVLVAGGRSSSSALTSSEVYNPIENIWIADGTLSQARYLHSASLLSDGRVMVAGGYSGSGGLATVEILNRCTVANAGQDKIVEPLKTIYLNQQGFFHMGEENIAYKWEWITKPDDAYRAIIQDGENNSVAGQWLSDSNIHFYSETPGTYELRLTLRNLVGSCEETTTDEIVIEAIPVPDVYIQLTWTSTNSDYDLHLIRPEGSFSRDCSDNNDSDCHYCNCNTSNGAEMPCPERGCPGPLNAVDWNIQGLRSDDPMLLFDDISGSGPEVMIMSGAMAGDYRIAVENYSTINYNDQAKVKVWIHGNLMATLLYGPPHTVSGIEPGMHWNAGWIRVIDTENIEIIPDGTIDPS